MTRRMRFAVLIALLLCAVTYQGFYAWQSVRVLRHYAELVDKPFSVNPASATITDVGDEARQAGIAAGDFILAIDGEAYTGSAVLARRLAAARPGDTLILTLERTGNQPVALRLAPLPAQPMRLVLIVVIGIATPLFCLLLGFGVVFRRPDDFRAWLLLLLMLSFSQVASANEIDVTAWPSPWRALALVWHVTLALAWPIWMLLFGLHFPERLLVPRRWAWLPWLVVAPLAAQCVIGAIAEVAMAESLPAAAAIAPIAHAIMAAYKLLLMVAISGFFMCLGAHSGMARSPDARRRLKLLFVGANVSLVPSGLLFMAGILTHHEMSDFPPWLLLPALFALALFPITLAYVIVVHQAMDVRVVVRQGLQYALARNGVLMLRIVASTAIVVAAVMLVLDPTTNRPGKLRAMAMGVTFVIVVRQVGQRLSAWTDRRFFREAYDAETLLNDLGESVRTIVETDVLLRTVATRLSESMHVPKLAVVLRDDGHFKPAYAIGFDVAPAASLEASAGALERLQSTHQAMRVGLNDPASWINRAGTPEERQALESLDAELLLALAVKDKLLGFVSLGPKRSEEPYSASDLRVLQSVAGQTALALENSQLTAAMAREVARRERLNRELEIAREVQEGLFPQHAPAVPGLEYAGRCRPALGVGGDYYDFLEISGGCLGIAIGDVSGKGIPAALLMAGLQASLRAQATLGPGDLAEMMARLNRLVFDASPPNRYVTFFFGHYDPASRRLDYVNAGHLAPMVLRGSEVLRLEDGGPVVGLLPVASYREARVSLQPGDLIVAFTDGISEAMSTQSEEWGEERMLDAVRVLREKGPEKLLDGIIEAADHFAAGAKQYDDMTLVVMRIL